MFCVGVTTLHIQTGTLHTHSGSREHLFHDIIFKDDAGEQMFINIELYD